MNDMKDMNDLMLEREKLRYELITLQNEIDVLKNASDKSTGDFQAVKEDITRTINSLSLNIENLRRVRDEILNEISACEKRYEDRMKEVSAQEEKRNEVKYQIEESMDVLVKQNYAREALLAEIGVLENNLKGFKNETANIDRFEKKLTSSEEKLAFLKEELSNFVRDVMTQIEDRERTIEQKTGIYESLKRDVNQMEISRDSILNELSTAKKDLDSVKFLLKESEEELFSNNEKREKMLLKIENLEAKKRQYERFIDGIPDETREMLEKQELSETRQEIEALRREADVIKAGIDKIKSEESELLKEKDSLYGAIEELKKEIGAKEKEKSGMETSLETLNLELWNLSEKQELMEKIQREKEADEIQKNEEFERIKEEIERFRKEIKEKDKLIESFLNKDDDELA